MKKHEGSYTIEAAVILPVVMLVIASLYIFFTAMVLEIQLESAMESVGRSASAYYLAVEKISEEQAEKSNDESSGVASQKTSLLSSFSGKTQQTTSSAKDSLKESEQTTSSDDSLIGETFESLLSEAVGGVLWYPIAETVIKQWVLSEVGETWTENSLIEDGESGVSFFGSQYNADDETIILNANYTLVIPFAHILPVSIPMNSRVVYRVWSGKPMEQGEEAEDVVYVTETGTVYHTSLGCHYLKLSIREVSLSHLSSQRNESGAKYSACELCGDGSGSTLYVTSYGTRYHYERNCSGLKRTIKSIPLSEVGDRGLCSKCAAREAK